MTESLQITHTDLLDGIDRFNEFLSLQGPSPKELIVHPLADLAEKLKSVEGYKGLLGVGYPFYALDEETVLSVPSIGVFLEDAKQRIKVSAAHHGEDWPCAECQVVNKLPNLTDSCVPCDRVSFKPRDLFRALPDIDTIAVFETSLDTTEAQVEEILQNMGWVRFNLDIKGAFDGTIAVLSGNVGSKLPIDFHIATIEQLKETFAKMEDKLLQEQIGLTSRAWRAVWKDQYVDIGYSFAFSMTEIGQIDGELSRLIKATRQELLAKYGVDNIVAMVSRSRRCGAVISDLSLRGLLEKRLQSW